MTSIAALAIGAVIGAVSLAVSVPEGWAGVGRTFVSGTGSDANPCSRSQPCRSFAYALTQTNDYGEIVVLDSAGYGPVTIAQPVTITNPGGVEAGITPASNGDAITINPSSDVTITLRGLTLEGGNIGSAGIHVISGAEVSIIDCVVKNFTNGIYVSPNRGTVKLLVINTLSLNNFNSGLRVDSATAAIYRSVFSRNGQAMFIASSAKVQLADSHAVDNAGVGINNLGNLTMENSSAELNEGIDVENQAGTLALLQNNRIINFFNAQGASWCADGTNDIAQLTDNGSKTTCVNRY